MDMLHFICLKYKPTKKMDACALIYNVYINVGLQMVNVYLDFKFEL